MTAIIFLAVSFFASVAGAICGIGGGVIIKPTLDLFKLASVPAISFLSSCTVLAMSGYSVGKAMVSGTSRVERATAIPLAVGAAVGGIAGQRLFGIVAAAFPDGERVGAIQSAVLVAMTVGTLLYTLAKHRVRTRRLASPLLCVAIGLALGVLSSFLGIGGGPINLVVLYYFFSMDAKGAAQNSLFVILFSQIANIAAAVAAGAVPAFDPASLALMIAGGIGGGIAGRAVYARMDNRAVERLFVSLMVVIIGIGVYNVVQYSI